MELIFDDLESIVVESLERDVEFSSPNQSSRLSRSTIELISLANSERLCKLKQNQYVICKDFCCGEFWESAPPFCCPNNFKPIRNLFLFLLIAFIGLFISSIIFLFFEGLAKCDVMKRIKMMEELYQAPSFSEMQTVNREWKSSDETSLDEDSLERDRRTSSKPSKQMLSYHSQSFKDMSRLNLQHKRNRKTNSRP